VSEFTKKKKKLSVLINNAAMALNAEDLTLKSTSDDLEITMATNHFGLLCIIHGLILLLLR